VLLAFASGALIDAACGPYRGKGTGEMSLLLQILGSVAAGDIVGGDRLYGSYLLLASLLGQGSDGCFRLNISREENFGQGERLGEDDYLQTWSKPCRPKFIDKQTWDRLPQQIKVRVLRLVVARRGFRTKEVYIVTTLCDEHQYSKEDIGILYQGRWNAELDIRALKQGLGMKMLSCKTPEMVRTEWWMHLLGYNLVRMVLAQAAWDKGLKPRELSFSGAVSVLDAFRWLLSCGNKDSEEMAQVLSTALASHRVGKRPGRYEPRETKHRQRKYKELKKSRQQRREELAAGENDQQDKGRAKGRGRDRPSGR
jgi:putative transposase